MSEPSTDEIRARAEAAISNGAVNHDLLRALLDALARAKAEALREAADEVPITGPGQLGIVTWLRYRADRIDPTEGNDRG